jgi:RNA polymerase sigma-70 factor, ECF subfamily
MNLKQIFDEHASYVWRVLRRLGVDDADVEDVCQEVFLVVHRKLDTFDGRSAMRTWLYGICLRVASEYRRRPHRRREQVAETVPEQSMPATQDDALDRRRALDRLDAALDQLDDDKRAVFVLYEIEQLPMMEIALAAGCPLQTAYSRLRAARAHVEAAMRRTELGAPRAAGARQAERSSV